MRKRIADAFGWLVDWLVDTYPTKPWWYKGLLAVPWAITFVAIVATGLLTILTLWAILPKETWDEP